MSCCHKRSREHSDAKFHSIIFELIKGEMQYVRDLENIDVVSDTITRLAYILFDFGLLYRSTFNHCERRNHPSSPATACRPSLWTPFTTSAHCMHNTANFSIASMQSSVMSTRSSTVSQLQSSTLRSTGVMSTWSTLRTIPLLSIASLTKLRTILPLGNLWWYVQTVFISHLLSKSAALSLSNARGIQMQTG